MKPEWFSHHMEIIPLYTSAFEVNYGISNNDSLEIPRFATMTVSCHNLLLQYWFNILLRYDSLLVKSLPYSLELSSELSLYSPGECLKVQSWIKHQIWDFLSSYLSDPVDNSSAIPTFHINCPPLLWDLSTQGNPDHMLSGSITEACNLLPLKCSVWSGV